MSFKKIRHILRAVRKNKLALVTNIIGLSMGLAATILLVVFILHEWSYDKHFNHSERICRLHSVWISEGSSTIQPINLRSTYTEIPQKVAGIDEAVQIYRGGSTELTVKNVRFDKNRLLYADSTFFRLFDFNPLEGNLSSALTTPDVIVLTKSLAHKIFGRQSAVGEVIEMSGKSFTVSAVIEDVPVNTHFTFDLLLPMESLEYLAQLQGLEFFTYYLLNPNSNHLQVNSAINETNKQLLDDRFKSFGYEFSSETEPIERLHLFANTPYDLGTQGSLRTVIVVGIIAFLVLFLALTNFVNLFIVEGEQRAREIGVRKVNGAGKANLASQFFAETSFIVGISFITGLAIALLLLPQFGNLMQRQFSWELMLSPVLIAALAAIFVVTIVLSGSYPAFYLSRLKPVSILKPGAGKSHRKRYILNLAGGMQLVVTLFLITILFGVNNQIHYLKNLSPGFNPDGLINVYNLNDNLKKHYPAIKEKLLQISEITGVAASSHTIGSGTSGQGIRLIETPKDNVLSINEYRIQPGLCELLELKIKEGRFFDPQRENDRKRVILNETAVRELGLTSAVGRQVVMFEEPLEVIGVVEDFRYQSAANRVQPLVLTAYSKEMRTILVRTNPGADLPVVMDKIGQTLRTFDEDYIMNASLTRDIYDYYYAGEDKLANLAQMGALLAVVIVMMGIFMLVSQNIARRTKEIGVRKVLGGSTLRMLALIYSNSLKWTGVAALIAVPLSYIYLLNWLQDYAVKAPLNWWLFVSGLVIVLVLEALITLGQTWRAATRNPVDSLRYE